MTMDQWTRLPAVWETQPVLIVWLAFCLGFNKRDVEVKVDQDDDDDDGGDVKESRWWITTGDDGGRDCEDDDGDDGQKMQQSSYSIKSIFFSKEI